MRIDLFLKNSRIIKRRTISKSACDSGRVLINGKVCKAGDDVKVGDIIEIKFGDNSPKFKVLDIIENSRKDNMDRMVEQVE